jgi:hypothetical protein
MNEIPERAFVIAERLRERQCSEAEIRAALAEFELSEKQIKEVLKKAELESPYVEMSHSQRQYFAGIRRNPFTMRLTRPSGKPLAGKSSLMDDIKDMFAGIFLRILLVAILLGLAFACGYFNYSSV